jgi:hypothetical protein
MEFCSCGFLLVVDQIELILFLDRSIQCRQDLFLDVVVYRAPNFTPVQFVFGKSLVVRNPVSLGPN